MDTNTDLQDLVVYTTYSKEEEIPILMEMIASELSEPYSIYTYRYFLTYWPNMCFLAYVKQKMVGVVIGKLERHGKTVRGYLAMIVVLKEYRRLKIGKKLVELLIEELKKFNCDELVLETETTNTAALRFYENLGFLKEKIQSNYYMNGNGAYRLKLYFSSPEEIDENFEKYTERLEKYPFQPDYKYHANDLLTNPLFKDVPNYWNYLNQKEIEQKDNEGKDNKEKDNKEKDNKEKDNKEKDNKEKDNKEKDNKEKDSQIQEVDKTPAK